MEKLKRMGKSWFVVTKYDELFGTNIGDSIKIKSLKLRKYEYERTKQIFGSGYRKKKAGQTFN